MSSTSRRTVLITVILLSAVLLALGNVLCHALVVEELTGTAPSSEPGLLNGLIHALGTAISRHGYFVWFFTGAPLLIGIVLAILVVVLQRDTPSAARGAGAPGERDTAGALRLLGLLQHEGRLIDFLEEDIDPYNDAQVGAAVRAIHAGCRSALRQRMRIERIYPEADGSTVEVPPGFDAGQVRLTGNVHGTPPFRGQLQHGGWRALDVALPTPAGVDPSVLAPAEVDVS